MWCTSNVFGSLATVLGGFKVGLVHTRRCALNEAAAITELVIVKAVRSSYSGGQAMWEPSDDMSGGKRIEILVLGSQGFVQKYRTVQKTTAQAKPETSRADASFMSKEGDSVLCTLDSWVVPVSPVAEVCCVLAALVKPFSSMIAREKTVLK